MKIILILTLLIFLNQSCDNNSDLPLESTQMITIDVIRGEFIEYDTDIDAYMGSIKIIDSTKQHFLSELYINPDNQKVFHRYQPIENYIGNDTLKLRKETINDTSNDLISIKNLTIILNIK